MPVPVSRITPETLVPYQVTMANASQIVEMLIELLAEEGIESNAAGVMVGQIPAWQITIHQSGYIDQIANIEDWIVLGFQGPTGPQVVVYPNVVYLETFTSNVPLVWGASTTAPVATAQSGASALIAAPLPGSANGPWTYTIQQTTGGQTTSFASTPTVNSSGALNFVVNNLTVGNQYTFTITISTSYSGVSPVTSLPTASITATN